MVIFITSRTSEMSGRFAAEKVNSNYEDDEQEEPTRPRCFAGSAGLVHDIVWWYGFAMFLIGCIGCVQAHSSMTRSIRHYSSRSIGSRMDKQEHHDKLQFIKHNNHNDIVNSVHDDRKNRRTADYDTDSRRSDPSQRNRQRRRRLQMARLTTAPTIATTSVPSDRPTKAPKQGGAPPGGAIGPTFAMSMTVPTSTPSIDIIGATISPTTGQPSLLIDLLTSPPSSSSTPSLYVVGTVQPTFTNKPISSQPPQSRPPIAGTAAPIVPSATKWPVLPPAIVDKVTLTPSSSSSKMPNPTASGLETQRPTSSSTDTANGGIPSSTVAPTTTTKTVHNITLAPFYIRIVLTRGAGGTPGGGGNELENRTNSSINNESMNNNNNNMAGTVPMSDLTRTMEQYFYNGLNQRWPNGQVTQVRLRGTLIDAVVTSTSSGSTRRLNSLQQQEPIKIVKARSLNTDTISATSTGQTTTTTETSANATTTTATTISIQFMGEVAFASFVQLLPMTSDIQTKQRALLANVTAIQDAMTANPNLRTQNAQLVDASVVTDGTSNNNNNGTDIGNGNSKGSGTASGSTKTGGAAGSDNMKNTTKIIIGAVVGGGIVLLAAAVALLMWGRTREKNEFIPPPPPPPMKESSRGAEAPLSSKPDRIEVREIANGRYRSLDDEHDVIIPDDELYSNVRDHDRYMTSLTLATRDSQSIMRPREQDDDDARALPAITPASSKDDSMAGYSLASTPSGMTFGQDHAMNLQGQPRQHQQHKQPNGGMAGNWIAKSKSTDSHTENRSIMSGEMPQSVVSVYTDVHEDWISQGSKQQQSATKQITLTEGQLTLGQNKSYLSGLDSPSATREPSYLPAPLLVHSYGLSTVENDDGDIPMQGPPSHTRTAAGDISPFVLHHPPAITRSATYDTASQPSDEQAGGGVHEQDLDGFGVLDAVFSPAIQPFQTERHNTHSRTSSSNMNGTFTNKKNKSDSLQLPIVTPTTNR